MSSWDTTRFGGATNPQTQTQDIEQDAPETNPKSQDAPVVEVHPHTETVDDSRAAFLATFTPKEQKEIIRKVDRRILVLIGLIYLVKQIDVNNAANVKVLAVGKPTNIMTQLSMTADQCNW
ncbi:hypothetical protein BJY04DRAFT_219255, partial [Aspergillus karnatakaensis]|uniref:uncharacterized protein n=1 Tax=Aspergillus karnatakaensis TaxID=1810916 RepID=UPI003CCE0CE9